MQGNTFGTFANAVQSSGRQPLQGKASSTFFLAAAPPPSLALNSPPLDFAHHSPVHCTTCIVCREAWLLLQWNVRIVGACLAFRSNAKLKDLMVEVMHGVIWVTFR